jgi:outer membrane lipoprotein-sorting protein
MLPSTLNAQTIALPELMATLASAESSRATFVETRHSALLRTPLVSRGTLTYQRPSSLEKHVLHPYDERIVLEGDTLTVENRTRSTIFTTSKSSSLGIAALVDGMRAIRAGDLGTLERYFALKVAGQRDSWSLTLKPVDEELRQYVHALIVSGTQNRITRIEVEESKGDRVVMEVREETR